MAPNAGAITPNPMAAPTIGVSLARTPVARPIIAASTAVANAASEIEGDLGRNALKAGAMKRRSAFATTPTAKIDARMGASAGTPVVRRTTRHSGARGIADPDTAAA
jgi:hypothetical protein